VLFLLPLFISTHLSIVISIVKYISVFEEDLKMKERSFILPNSESLSCEATGLLSTMLNHPESDYHTAEELCTFFNIESYVSERKSMRMKPKKRDKVEQFEVDMTKESANATEK
jgi:hypothetical protein